MHNCQIIKSLLWRIVIITFKSSYLQVLSDAFLAKKLSSILKTKRLISEKIKLCQDGKNALLVVIQIQSALKRSHNNLNG